MSILNPHPERKGAWAAALLVSTAMHAAAGVYALDVLPFGAQEEETDFLFPEIAISNIALQEQQLAALEPEATTTDATEEAETPDAPEAEELEATEPDAEELDAAEAEELEAAEPDAEELDAAEAEELDAAEPEAEELAAVEPDEAELAEPETVEAETVEAEELDTAEPEVPDVAETVEAVEPDAPEVAAVEQVDNANPVLTPVLPDEESTLQGSVVEQVATAAPVVQSVQPTTQVVTATTVTRVAPVAPTPRPEPAAQPAAPPPPPPPPPSPEELALAEQVKRIRERFGDTCLVALPQNGGEGQNPIVTLLSDTDRAMGTFVEEVLSDPEFPVDNEQTLVDNRQCAMLDYARVRDNYPTFQVNLSLTSRLVASGDNLEGTVDGFAGRVLAILIVDSNGVVQDLRNFVSFTQGGAFFSVPVNLNGPPRDTSQMIVAIGTRGVSRTVSQLNGRLASEFFPALEAEFGDDIIVAVLPFDVR